MQQEHQTHSLAFEVRRGRLEEAAALPAIERSAAQAFLSIPELAWIADDDVLDVQAHRHFVETGGSWVALDTARIIGFGCAERVEADLHVWELAVSEQHQGRGAGTALMAAIEAHARRIGTRRLTLTTFRDVPWNEAFYQRLGYRVLTTTELDARLRYVLELEVRAGMPQARRCAMERRLTSS